MAGTLAAMARFAQPSPTALATFAATLRLSRVGWDGKRHTQRWGKGQLAGLCRMLTLPHARAARSGDSGGGCYAEEDGKLMAMNIAVDKDSGRAVLVPISNLLLLRDMIAI